MSRPTASRPTGRLAAPWLLLAVVLILSLIGSLWWPMGRDQGITAWVAGVIGDGGMSYRDAWDVRGPGIHYLYHLAQALFGPAAWGLRLFDSLLLLAGSLALGATLWRAAGPAAARWGMSLNLLWYLNMGWWGTAQPDAWVAQLLAIAAYLITSQGERPSAKTAVAGGLFVGLCLLIKPLYALAGLLLPLYALLRWPGPANRPAVIRWTALAAAAALGLTGLALLWFAIRGALEALIDVQLRFNLTVHATTYSRPPLARLWEVARQLRSDLSWLLMATPLALAGLWWGWQRARPLAALLLGWSILGGLALFGQDKFYFYHWHVLLPPLAGLAAVGIGRLTAVPLPRPALARRWLPAVAGRGWLLLLLLLSAYIPAIYLVNWGTAVLGWRSWAAHDQLFITTDYDAPAMAQIVNHLAANSPPEAYVYVWGFDPYPNFAAGRRAPTRFGYHYPLNREAAFGAPNPFEAGYRQELLADLVARPPAYILVGIDDTNVLMPRSSRQLLADFPELTAYLEGHFALETTIGHYELWRRAVNLSNR